MFWELLNGSSCFIFNYILKVCLFPVWTAEEDVYFGDGDEVFEAHGYVGKGIVKYGMTWINVIVARII